MALAAENPLSGVFSAANLKAAEKRAVEVQPGPRPGSVLLTFPPSETPGELVVPVPDAARDWTPYRTFTFDFTSSSTIKWELQIRNRKGETFSFRVQPYQDVPVRAAIPASFLLRDYMNNRAFKGHALSNWGNHIDLAQVESLIVRMNPNREVKLVLGPLALHSQDLPDEVYVDKPVVDSFGQWIPLEWPGKVRSLDELRQAWKQEDAELAKPDTFGYCAYGGWAERKERVTGFFHTAEVDSRWWLVDPDGHLFFSLGQDCVRPGESSRVRGREKLFEKLPPGAESEVNFLRANALFRYGASEVPAGWKAKAIERLRAWGFNTVANWSDSSLYEKPALPFVMPLSIGRFARNWQGFPDAYSDKFPGSVEDEARAACARFRDEPLLIGYFIGNEPRWFSRNLVGLILADPSPSATQAFARRFLEEKGDNADSRAALLEALSRRYFQSVRDAIRKADPNHLVLGIRFAGSAPDPVIRANDVFDVFSINIYRFEPPAEQIERIYKMLKKPILIGEFHFGAAERGYAPSLVMVRDQQERGVAYQYYVEKAAALAPVIGTHYFQMWDQPVSGRFDGENYNLGFVNQQDVPYPDMVSFAKATHRRSAAIHAGTLPATGRQARVR